MGRQLVWRLRHHHHHHNHHHHNHHRLVVTKLYVKRETCPSVLSGTSSPCSAATARLHESAASLIFCQTDLTGKHEGVRSRAAVRHTASVCLSVFWLSVCGSAAWWLQHDIYCGYPQGFYRGSARMLNAPCPPILLYMRVHQMDYDTLSVDMSASQTPCVRTSLPLRVSSSILNVVVCAFLYYHQRHCNISSCPLELECICLVSWPPFLQTHCTEILFV